MRFSGDCFISDRAAVHDEETDAELHRQACRQAGQGVKQGHWEKQLHLNGSADTNAKEVT